MLFCTLAVSICTHYLIAQTDGKADSATEQTQSENQVGKALKKLKTFNGKPNTNAKFYIYLQSASWCGWTMPKIISRSSEQNSPGSWLTWEEVFRASNPPAVYPMPLLSNQMAQ